MRRTAFSGERKSAVSNPVAGPKSVNLSPLTSMRFVAALLVVLWHAADSLNTPALFPQPWTGRFVNLVLLGRLSVSFFFFLSGYVLAVSYLASGRVLDRRRFWISRIARIYPLFLLTILIDVPNLLIERMHKYGTAVAIEKTTVTFSGTVFLLHGWVLPLRGLNAPCWSLSAQMLFYCCFPFAGLWIWRLKRPQVLLGISLLYIGGQVAVLGATRVLSFEAVRSHPVLHLFTFLLGILVARLWAAPGFPSQRLPLSPVWSSALLSLAAGVFLAALMRVFPLLPFQNLHNGLLAPVYAALIYMALHPGLVFSRLLRAPWLVALGNASFGLYLIHMPVLKILFFRMHVRVSIATFTFYLLLSTALSVASLRWFEEPARQWVLRRFAQPRRLRESLVAASTA